MATAFAHRAWPKSTAAPFRGQLSRSDALQASEGDGVVWIRFQHLLKPVARFLRGGLAVAKDARAVALIQVQLPHSKFEFHVLRLPLQHFAQLSISSLEVPLALHRHRELSPDRRQIR